MVTQQLYLSTMSQEFTVMYSTILQSEDEWNTAKEDVSSGDCLRLDPDDLIPWDNPYNIVSRKVSAWINDVISIGAIPLLWLVGSAGNVLSGMAFYRQGLNHPVRLCLFCLAIVDFLALTGVFLLYAESAYNTLVGPSIFCITNMLWLTGFIPVSQFLSAVISLERCFCVVRPFKTLRLLTTRKMALFIGLSSAILLLGMVVLLAQKYTVKCVSNPANNSTMNIQHLTSYYLKNRRILDIMDIFVYSTVLPAIFFLVITVASILTASGLRSARKWRLGVLCTPVQHSFDANGSSSPEVSEDTRRNQQAMANPLKEAALTRTLLGTSILFLLCLIPNLAIQIATFFVEDLQNNGRFHNLSSILWAFIALFKAFNCSLNFFIYYGMSSRFKKTLKECLRYRSCRKD